MEERGREMQGRKRSTIGMMVSGIMEDALGCIQKAGRAGSISAGNADTG